MVVLAGETRAGGDPSSYTTTVTTGYEPRLVDEAVAKVMGIDLSGFDIGSIDIPTPTVPDIALPNINLPSKEDILTPIAETTFNVLDPLYGEGGALEPVTEQVREGDLIGAGLEATEIVFVDPSFDYVEEKLEPGYEALQENKELVLLGAGLLALLLLRK